MLERERNQHGLRRRKRNCVGSMRNIVILKVCFVSCLLAHISSVGLLLKKSVVLHKQNKFSNSSLEKVIGYTTVHYICGLKCYIITS